MASSQVNSGCFLGSASRFSGRNNAKTGSVLNTGGFSFRERSFALAGNNYADGGHPHQMN